MKKLRKLFLSDKLGASYAISAVIMTSVTIVLVLITSNYAYQVLEQQRAAAEFEVAKKSILTFNDALESIAWKPEAARSTRFTINYGQLELIPDDRPESLTLIVNASVGTNTVAYSTSTGFIRYRIKNQYVNFAGGYKSYILGDESLIVTSGTKSSGRAVIEQKSGWVNISLTYGVRAIRTSVITVNGEQVNYVDIWLIKIVTRQWLNLVGDFDLKANCTDVKTYPYGPYSVTGGQSGLISARLGSTSSSASISLVTGKVVFNFVVANIQVTV